jgi:hypothetical protein
MPMVILLTQLGRTKMKMVRWLFDYGILHIDDAIPAGAEDIFGFGNVFVNGIPENALRDGQLFFVPRQHRGVGEWRHRLHFITLAQ